MGTCCTKTNIVNDELILSRETSPKKNCFEKNEYRWFWNLSEDPWNVDKKSDYFWAIYSLEISDKIEESFQQRLPEHQQGNDYIIKFNYQTLQHLQIDKKDPTKKRQVRREIPSNIQNVLRVERPGNTQVKAYDIFENNYLAQLELFFYKDLFANFEIDESDPFICRFTSHFTLLDKTIATFLLNDYTSYLKQVHKLELLNFKKLKDIFYVDLQKEKTKDPLHHYVNYYVDGLTQENFALTMAQMYTEEGQLYKNLNQMIRHMQFKEHMEYTFFFLSFLFVYGNRDNRIEEDILVYRGTASTNEQYENLKSTYAVEQVVINYDFMSTSRNIEIARMSMNGRNLPRKILFEILVEKESNVMAYLSFKPFDVKSASMFPGEEEIILPPNGVFQVKGFEENEVYTKIQMEYRTNLIQNCREIIEKSTIAHQYGFANPSGINEQYYDKIVTIQRTNDQLDLNLLSKMKNLRHLDLKENNIGFQRMKDLISQINCTNLQYLDISRNAIGEEGMQALSSHLNELINLQHLDLSQNDITAKDIKEFAANFVYLKSLQWLNISNNLLGNEGMQAMAVQFVYLPNLEYLNLFWTDIGSEGLKSLSNELFHLPKLSYLNLSKIGVEDEGFTEFANQFSHLTHLKQLDLSWNTVKKEALLIFPVHLKNLHHLNLEYIDLGIEEMKAFSSQLIHFTNLLELNLSGIKSGLEGIKEFASHLIHLANLRILNLQSCVIGDEGMKALSLHLNHLVNLQQLILNYNDIRDEGIKAFAVQIIHLKNLECLNIDSNHVGVEGLIECAKQLIHLQKFNMLKCQFNDVREEPFKILEIFKSTDQSWVDNDDNFQRDFLSQTNKKELFSEQFSRQMLIYQGQEVKLTSREFHCLKSFQYYQNIKEMDLSENKLVDEDLILFSTKLIHLPNLQSLNLGGNILRTAQIQALGPQLVHLQKLNLFDSQLGDEGMVTFSAQLFHFTNLTLLNLGQNEITNLSFKSFVSQMIHLKNLQHLILCRNSIGDEGIKAFAEQLIHFTNLRQLDASFNHIRNEGLKVFSEQLIHLKNIENLNFEQNQIGNEGVLALASQMIHLSNIEILNVNNNLPETRNVIGELFRQAQKYCPKMVLEFTYIG